MLQVGRSIGAGLQELTVSTDTGEPVETIVIDFAGARIVGIAREDSLQLVCTEDLAVEEAGLIARASERVRTNSLVHIKREGSRGRSRLQLVFDDVPGGARLSRVVIEQRLFLTDNSPESRQRTVDALFEIASLATRVRIALDGVIEALLAGRGLAESDFHDGMYG